MKQADLDVLQSVLTRLLRHFDSACRDAGVDYFLDCGTLLGAVRHGGWIPWDDDVDVVMWREDYERLREHLRAHPDPQTHLWDPLREDGSGVLPRFTIVDSSVAVVDIARLGHPERARIALDVYVIDTAPSQKWLVTPWLSATRLLQAVRFAKGCTRDRMRVWQPRHQRWLLTLAWLMCRAIPQRWIQRAYRQAATAFRGRSDIGHCLNGVASGRGHPIPRRWFGSHKVAFDGCTYLAPDPDPYLTAMYGPQYLTPPPPRQRVDHDLVTAHGHLDGIEIDV